LWLSSRRGAAPCPATANAAAPAAAAAAAAATRLCVTNPAAAASHTNVAQPPLRRCDRPWHRCRRRRRICGLSAAAQP